MAEFHSTNTELTAFVVSVYLIGYATGPLVIAPLSELYGRLYVYHINNVLFIIFTVACALSPSLSALIGFRFLAGCAGSTPVTLGGGTVADVIHPSHRGLAMSLYILGMLLGPVLGPVAGGFFAQAEGWRWTFWVLAIAVGRIPLSHETRTRSIALTELIVRYRYSSYICIDARDIRSRNPREESTTTAARDRKLETSF